MATAVSSVAGVAAVAAAGWRVRIGIADHRLRKAAQAASRRDRPSATLLAPCYPYPGLDAFTAEAADYFYGRERLVDEILRLLAVGGRSGPLAIVGRSGVGKSSLLRAGLLPAINAGRLDSHVPGVRHWPQLVMTPGEHPLGELARRLVVGTGQDETSIAASLAADPGELPGLLDAVRRDGHAPDGLILCVDQFEEVFTACADEAERQAFIRAICQEGGGGEAPRLQVIFGLRADFYGHCLEYPELCAVLDTRQVLVRPMSREELRSAIEDPARTVGLRLEEGFTEVLLSDLESAEGPGRDVGSALPLLAFALQTTWQESDKQVLTLSDYKASGGIRAVTQRAEEVYESLGPARDATKILFLSMVQLGDGTDAVRRRVRVEDLLAGSPATKQAAVKNALDAYVAARLVMVDYDTAEIAHDALLQAWPRLRAWLDENRADKIARSGFSNAAREWAAHNRDPAYLYRGSRLSGAVVAAKGPGQDGRFGYWYPSALDVEFLAASRHARWYRTRKRVSTTLMAFVQTLLAAVLWIAHVVWKLTLTLLAWLGLKSKPSSAVMVNSSDRKLRVSVTDARPSNADLDRFSAPDSEYAAGDGASGNSLGRNEGAGGGAGDWARRAEPPSRYITGSMPERAAVGRRIGLVVQVTLDRREAGSALLRSLDVPYEGCDITITVTAPGLRPLGDLEQDLHVPSKGDSDPIRFGFQTDRVGLHHARVRVFAAGTFLGELLLEISVEVGAAMEEGPPRSALLEGLAAEPGEVTLQVSRTDDDRYSFQLIGEALYPVELSRRLAGDPTQVVRALADELRAMAAGASPYENPVLVRNRITSLGAQLWSDVVPDAIRRQFWEQADRIRLFTVASDTDTVPWELLYPVDGDHDNGFLAEQFPVIRRVYGQGRVRNLNLSSAAYIVPPGSPANAMDEVQSVRALLGGSIRDQGVCSRLDSLIRLLEDTPSVLHFACHNAFTDTEGSAMNLEGGPWRPSDLSVSVQRRSLAGACPLVFLNACRTAGEVPGLMHMMGWARQFMGAGAGAFIGSLWAVRSSSAREFADEFYRALVAEGKPLGAASQHARQAISADGGDPTWLAYTIYGNPSATVGDAFDRRRAS